MLLLLWYMTNQVQPAQICKNHKFSWIIKGFPSFVMTDRKSTFLASVRKDVYIVGKSNLTSALVGQRFPRFFFFSINTNHGAQLTSRLSVVTYFFLFLFLVFPSFKSFSFPTSQTLETYPQPVPVDSSRLGNYVPYGLSLGIQSGLNGLSLDHPILGKGLYPQVELGFRMGLDFRLFQLWGMSFSLVQGYQLPITLGNQVIIPRGLEYLEGQFLVTRFVPLGLSVPIVESTNSQDGLPTQTPQTRVIQGLSLRGGLGLVYANYLYTQVYLWYPSINISALAWSHPIPGIPLGFLFGPELSLGFRRDPGITLGAGFIFQVVLPL